MGSKRTIIIDDENDAIANLSILLAEFCPQLQLVHTFNNPLEAVMWLKENSAPEVLFVDVQMPAINGFELLQLANLKKTKVIFVTAHEKFALKAIDFHPFAYLVKPVDIDKLISVYEQIQLEEKPLVDNRLEENVKIPTSTGFRFVQISNIIFIKADRSYCQIVLQGGERIMVSRSLGKFMQSINHPTLFRCHKSAVINLKKVTEFVHRDGGTVILENEYEVSVSKDAKDRLLEKLTGKG